MCLSIVDEKMKFPKGGYGYKVFVKGKYPDTYKGDMFDRGCVRKPGFWYKAKKELVAWPGYDSGFHIFANFVGAKRWADDDGYAICKVQYRKGRLSGKQEIADHSYSVIVADEMKILKTNPRTKP